MTRVSLKLGTKEYHKEFSSDRFKSQMVLPLLAEVLSEAKLTPPDIAAIEVHPGPGSFTGLRVGYTVAQILGTFLNVPVNSQPADKLTPPTYGQSQFE